MLRELQFATRRLIRDRWTTATALLTVALGAGLTVAVFAAGYALLLRPLPYDASGRLWLANVHVPFTQIDDWRSRLTTFERVTAYATEGLVVAGIGDPRLVRSAYVDGRFFETVAQPPAAGRLLARDDSASAVVSERFARTVGVSAETLVGRPISAGGTALTIVGVVPESFSFPASAVEIWIPAANARPIKFDRSNDSRRFRLAGRLAPGVPEATALEQVARVQRDLQSNARDAERPQALLERAHAAATREIRPTLLVLAGAAGLVWIVTCVNLATVLVSRTIRRRRELAVCDALGAGRLRRAISVLAESMVIAIAGTALGLVLALASMDAAAAWAGELNPRPGELSIGGVPIVLAGVSSLVLSIVATLLAMPAGRARVRGMHTRDAGPTTQDRRLRGALLVAQLALVVVLVSGGALLVRTLTGLLATDLGLDVRGALVSQLILTPATTLRTEDRQPVVRALLERTRQLPGVQFAGAGSSLPPDNAQIEISVTLDGERGEESHRLSTALVTPGYLEAIGARLLAGRTFEQSDADGPPTVVLSESAARALMRDTTVPGRELPFALPGVPDRRKPIVVGVVADIRYSGLEAQPGPAIYVPWHLNPLGQGYLAVRTSGTSPATTIAAVRAVLRELDPTLPHMPMRTFDEIVERSVGIRRVAALVGATLATLAFGVGLAGLAGSVLRSVEERRRELAIRTALGAAPSRVVWLVASQVVTLSAIGLMLGLGGAFAAARAMRTLVHGVGSYDVATVASVAALVMIASLGAAYLPARLAAGIDPAQVLKHD